MPIPQISLSNTFSQWLLTTQTTVSELNKLESDYYVKTANTFFITSPGVGLSVTNSASFGTVTTNTLIVTANINFGNVSGGIFSADSAAFNKITVTGNGSINGISLSNNFITIGKTPKNNGTIFVNRGGDSLANSNAAIRWNETQSHWEIKDVNNPTNYYRLVSSNTTKFGIGTPTPNTSLHIIANDAIIIPSGSDLERPTGVNGMIRYNTSNNYIEMYANNNWSVIGSGAGGSAIIRQQFVASSNQTSFTISGGYSPGQIDVYYNGSKLLNGTDVNISSGSEIVLSSGATENAIIDVVGLQTYAINGATSNPVRQIFVAQQGQTAFNILGGYNSGQIDVYYNGIKLINGTEVDVSTGGQIVLSQGAVGNSIIEVVGISSIAYMDAVKKSGDTMTGDLIVSGTIRANSLIANTMIGNFGSIIATGTITAEAFNSTSDLNLKENVENINNAIQILNTITPVEFTWKNSGKKSYGVIAQELENVLPELVSENNGIKTVEYLPLISFLIGAVKDLTKRVEDLENL